jgi:hypothetical protein
MATQTIKGKLSYQDISGGFWGIIGDDGERYRPVEGVPEAFRKEGLQVTAEVEPYTGFSIFMWGQDVHLKNITAGNS